MNTTTLEEVWKSLNNRVGAQLRFDEWDKSIRYFVVEGESDDGKRLVGNLDSGERMSFSKGSRGWLVYNGKKNLEDLLVEISMCDVQAKQVWIHTKSSNTYFVDHVGQVRHPETGEWALSVTYKPTNEPMIPFTRFYDDFKSSFKPTVWVRKG